MIADLFITTKGRIELLLRSLESLERCTERHDYRLTVVVDDDAGGSFKTVDKLSKLMGLTIPTIDHLIVHGKNLGLGPSINQALAHIDVLNKYYEHPTHGDPDGVAQFICYSQDDLLYTPDWLPKLAKLHMMFERSHNIGFSTGLECVEHETREKITDDILLKDWIRAAQMFGRRSYWMSMFPISRLDSETGRVRAKPNDGMGSSVDWWFVRDHKNSVCKTGRTCLVMPGLVQHLGYKESTWLDRELPESLDDKNVIAQAVGHVPICHLPGCTLSLEHTH